MSQSYIRKLQTAINARAKSRWLPEITVDGELGPETLATGRRVAWLMGVKLGPKARLIGRARDIIVNPGRRTPAERARALARVRLRPLRLRAWDQMAHLIALKVTEQGSNNHGVWVEKIIRANGGVPGEPWCGDTVAACYLWAGAKTVVRSFASVSWLIAALTPVSPKAVKRGHIVTYKFSHTGLFDEWINYGVSFRAGEGNTGNVGAVSDSQTGGDGVKLKVRTTDLVAGYRRVLR